LIGWTKAHTGLSLPKPLEMESWMGSTWSTEEVLGQIPPTSYQAPSSVPKYRSMPPHGSHGRRLDPTAGIDPPTCRVRVVYHKYLSAPAQPSGHYSTALLVSICS